MVSGAMQLCIVLSLYHLFHWMEQHAGPFFQPLLIDFSIHFTAWILYKCKRKISFRCRNSWNNMCSDKCIEIDKV